jgi:hypothetical protein
MDALEITGSLFHGALDILLRHRTRFCRVDRRAQPRISGGVAAAQLRGHRDLANELGELRAALGVGGRLVMLDLFPLAVTGHDQLWYG